MDQITEDELLFSPLGTKGPEEDESKEYDRVESNTSTDEHFCKEWTGLKIVWEFKNFSKDFYSFKDAISSPTFSLSLKSGFYQFAFAFYPCGKTPEQNDKFAALYPTLLNNVEERIELRLMCSVINSKKFENLVMDRSPQISTNWRKGAAWVFSKKSLCDRNFALEIQVFYKNADVKDTSSSRYVEELSRHLLKAYEEGLLSDTSIKCHDKVCRLHGAMIEARFPEFHSLDISKARNLPVLQKLVLYLYGGNLDNATLSALEFHSLSAFKSQSILLSNPEEIRAETLFYRTNLSFPWKIQNFRNLKPGKVLSCFICSPETRSLACFKACLRVSEPSAAKGCKIRIVISLQNYLDSNLSIVCRLTVAGIQKVSKHRFISYERWNVVSLRQEALPWLPNDVLDIRFDIHSFNLNTPDTRIVDILSRPLVTNVDEPFSNGMNQLRRDMRKLMLNSKVFDWKLIAGSEVFDVHKFVLCARSPTFRRLIEKTRSSSGKPETITNLEASVAKSLISYIYCADVDIADFVHALKLYQAAHSYELFGLKKECVAFLKPRLNPENSLQVLVAADECSDQELSSLAMEYSCSTLLSRLSSTEKNVLEKKELVKKLLEATMKRLEETEQ